MEEKELIQSTYPMMRKGSNVIRWNPKMREMHLLTLLIPTITIPNRGTIPFAPGLTLDLGIHFAVNQFNERSSDVLPQLPELLEGCDVYMTNEFRDTKFSPIEGSRQLYLALQENHTATNPLPTAVIGAAGSVVTVLTSQLAGIHGIPQVSPISTAHTLENREIYPYFGRTVPTVVGHVTAALNFFRFHKVSHFACIYIRNEFGNAFWSRLQHFGMGNFDSIVGFSFDGVGNKSQESIRSAIKNLKASGLRYVLGIFSPISMERVMLEAYRQDVAGNQDYFWLLHSLTRFTRDNWEVARALDRIGYMESFVPSSPRLHEKYLSVKDDQKLQRDFVTSYHDQSVVGTFDFSSGRIPSYTRTEQLGFDAVIAMGLAACSVEEDLFSGPQLYEAFTKVQFEGVSGWVDFNEVGTRRVESFRYSVNNLLLDEAQSNNETIVFESTLAFTFNSTMGTDPDVVAPFFFYGNSTQPPEPLPFLAQNTNMISPVSRGLGFFLAAITMLTSLFWSWFVYFYRTRNVVRASQPPFMYMTCAGTFIMGSSIIPAGLQEPFPFLDVACMLVPWLFSIGFVVAFSSLVCKALRLNQIVAHSREFRRVTVRPKDAIGPFLVLMGLNVLVLSVWSALDPLVWTRRALPSSLDQYGRPTETVGICASRSSLNQGLFLAAFALVNLAALVFANVETFKTRKHAVKYKEVVSVAISMAFLLEGLILGVPVLFLTRQNPTAFFVAEAVLVALVSFAILMPLFVPKVSLRNRRRPWNVPQMDSDEFPSQSRVFQSFPSGVFSPSVAFSGGGTMSTNDSGRKTTITRGGGLTGKGEGISPKKRVISQPAEMSAASLSRVLVSESSSSTLRAGRFHESSVTSNSKQDDSLWHEGPHQSSKGEERAKSDFT